MEILSEREEILLSGLRRGGKQNVLQIAIEHKIPKSTMFDSLRNLELNKIFTYKAIVDFEKVGFPIKIFYVIKTNMRNRTKLRIYLKDKRNVNSFYGLGQGADFLFECIFRNFKEVHEFEREIEDKFEVFDKQMFNVIENIKFESFLDKKEDYREDKKE